MGEYKIKYKSVIEKCTCCWDEVNKIWVKIFDAEKLPDDVIEQINNDLEKGKILYEAAKYKRGQV